MRGVLESTPLFAVNNLLAAESVERLRGEYREALV